MAHILFDHGKKIGEVSSWTNSTLPPAYKNVLGKTVLLAPANDECTFISPKPLNRKSQLTVIQDGKVELLLQLKSIKDGTVVVAKILKKTDIPKK